MSKRPVIGLIPAGGKATRISPLPLSKELYPVGFQGNSNNNIYKNTQINNQNNLRPKVVSHYLLEKMQLAGIDKAYFILRPGKWDIPAYFGDGAMLSMNLGYLIMGLPYGVPFTLDSAYPFVKDTVVALGFPDILFQPKDAYIQILKKLESSKADVVLGLFPTDKPQKAGMVNFDDTGKVYSIIEKPLDSNLHFMWAIAVWQPSFSKFLHEYLIAIKQDINLPHLPEIPIGNVIQAAISKGLQVEAEAFINGSYLDIGTPDDLITAVRGFAGGFE
ncbi:dTDP-glucose pyrophosphorylase [Plectonema cf. radiosum LEGE 06105]|uniref:Glucose-1-phosphate thymidylyltransferase n=1 Tax=Plectonema cf. radiosum LEGE 06105 TaxID=945769 RepID=A0A8J7EY12_9CYAN|nr:sugar phosphate nucleotidyltransferase [Plectonema radiosum]MBE9211888.1 dTDP-glucose pyrophosphorylase [Plectonema cf. radiosum LEGE 06105]